MKPIIIFGASTKGKTAYKKLKDKYNINYFLDNDENKWESKLCDLEIISPKKILEFNEDVLVVIASEYDIPISKQLIEMGIKKFGVYNGNCHRIDCFDYNDIKNIGRKENKVALIMSNNSGSNSFALYKGISEKASDKYDIVLINENDKNNNYYLDLLESRLVVHTHSNYFDEAQINLQLWHGFPLKTLAYMSDYTENIKSKRNIEWNKVNSIASYSKTYSTIMNACHGVDGDKYSITGMPRNDLLLSSKGRENLSKLLEINLNEKKIVFYMPTYRESIYGSKSGDLDDFSILNSKKFDLKQLDNFLGEQNALMILKLHPFNIKDTLSKFETMSLKNIYNLDDEKLLGEELDLYEVINAMDLLITDYSSIYFDYLLLDKPMIFTPLDIEKYSEKPGFLLEPYEFWTPGPKCFSLDELKDELKNSFKDNSYYKKERKIICDIVHHYKDNNSSERVWHLIKKLMSEE